MLWLLLSATGWAEPEFATSEEGRTVVLYGDGTWEPMVTGVDYSGRATAGQAPETEAATQESTEPEGFRGYPWGTPRSVIRKAEGAPEAVGANDVYSGKVAGLPVLMVYIYLDDQLARGRYIVTKEHTNKNSYINDFDALKQLLSKKYGQPGEDDTFWSNDLYQDDYSQWGFAISFGHHSRFATWETPESNVNLALFGENYSISLLLEYGSRSMADDLKAEAEQQSMDGL